MAFACRYEDGRLRLAVVKGDNASATLDGWSLASNGTTSVEVKDGVVSGTSSGAAHSAEITVAAAAAAAIKSVILDTQPVAFTFKEGTLAIKLPDGRHTFRLEQR